MEDVPHHLIDVLEPEEEFHVQKFQQMAKEAFAGFMPPACVPIVTGGTGFYIRALLYDIQFTMEESDPAYRQELAEYARKYGQEALHEKLAGSRSGIGRKDPCEQCETSDSCAGIFSPESGTDFQTQRRRTKENLSLSFCIFCAG